MPTESLDTSTESGAVKAARQALTDHEAAILRRMRRIDKGEGCWAAIQTIGESYYPDEMSKGRSQTRLHVRRLREKGYILPLGVTQKGMTVYLLPDRKLPYKPADIKELDHKRTSALRWDTSAARGLLGKQAPVIEERKYLGVHISARVLSTYSTAVWQAAVEELIRSYGPRGAAARHPEAALKAICKRIAAERKEEQAKRLQLAAAEIERQRKQTFTPPADSEQDQDMAREIAAAAARGISLIDAINQYSAGVRFTTQSAQSDDIATAPQTEANNASPTVGDAVKHLVIKRSGSEAPTPPTFHSQKAKPLERLLGPIRLTELTAASMSSYKAARRAENARDETVDDELKVLRQALIECASRGLVSIAVLTEVFPSRSYRRCRAPRGDP